jgi:hypothetical protein
MSRRRLVAAHEEGRERARDGGDDEDPPELEYDIDDLPECVIGFLKDEETVTICAVEKKSASPKPWMLLPFSLCSYHHMSDAQTASTTTERRQAMISRARSRR